ncbi:MAG: hypothetical protein ACLQUZ_10030 [Rhizomicrobium sp.]
MRVNDALESRPLSCEHHRQMIMNEGLPRMERPNSGFQALVPAIVPEAPADAGDESGKERGG